MRGHSILAGFGAGAAGALALTPFAGHAIGQLQAARTERARLAAVAEMPPPAVPRVEGAMRSGSAAAAVRAFETRLRDAAMRDGVLVEALEAGAPGLGYALVRLQLSGPEKAVLALVDSVERTGPSTRLRGWTVQTGEGASVRFAGEAVVPWQ